MSWRTGTTRIAQGQKWRDRLWRKVRLITPMESKRTNADGVEETVTIRRLALECGHVVFHAIITVRLPDQIICNACEREQAAATVNG